VVRYELDETGEYVDEEGTVIVESCDTAGLVDIAWAEIRSWQ
jgi:hypothetical protein